MCTSFHSNRAEGKNLLLVTIISLQVVKLRCTEIDIYQYKVKKGRSFGQSVLDLHWWMVPLNNIEVFTRLNRFHAAQRWNLSDTLLIFTGTKEISGRHDEDPFCFLIELSQKTAYLVPFPLVVDCTYPNVDISIMCGFKGHTHQSY